MWFNRSTHKNILTTKNFQTTAYTLGQRLLINSFSIVRLTVSSVVIKVSLPFLSRFVFSSFVLCFVSWPFGFVTTLCRYTVSFCYHFISLPFCSHSMVQASPLHVDWDGVKMAMKYGSMELLRFSYSSLEVW